MSSRGPVWGWEKLPEGQPSLQQSDLGFMAEWPDRSLSSARRRKASLRLRNKKLWSDETKIELLFNSKRPQTGAKGSPSNRTRTHTQLRQHRSGSGSTLVMSLSGPARAQTWTRFNISGEIWKWLCTDAAHPTWWSLRGPAKKNGRNCPKIGVPSL